MLTALVRDIHTYIPPLNPLPTATVVSRASFHKSDQVISLRKAPSVASTALKRVVTSLVWNRRP